MTTGKAILAVIAAVWTVVAAAIGAVIGPEIKDRWFPPTRSASIERFCLAVFKQPSRREVLVTSDVKVRTVGYKGRTVQMFTEVMGPTGDRVDAEGGDDLVQPDANDQQVVVYGEFDLRPQRRRTYGVIVYLADSPHPAAPNLDQRTLKLVFDRRGEPRVPRPCVSEPL